MVYPQEEYSNWRRAIRKQENILCSIGKEEKLLDEPSLALAVHGVAKIVKRGALLDLELNAPACVDKEASVSPSAVIEKVFKEMPEIHTVGICYFGSPLKVIIPRKRLSLFPEELA